MFNPIRFIKDLLVDLLILTTGTYIGSPYLPDEGSDTARSQNDSISD